MRVALKSRGSRKRIEVAPCSQAQASYAGHTSGARGVARWRQAALQDASAVSSRPYLCGGIGEKAGLQQFDDTVPHVSCP